MKVPAVLKNKYLFYALAVLAALNVIGYASVKAYECLALFLLAGYGMHCYCNNKSLSILAALFVANFVFGCGRVKEGFEEAMKAPEDLLKDAANAAADAGAQLSQQGKEAMADACAAITGTALDTKDACIAEKNKDGNACNYQMAMEANKCYKDGAVVTQVDVDGEMKTASATNCTGDGHTWSTSASPAMCSQ
tara:strand:- start:2562 stop:3140 length:579 start_codon:yes stop_codon:yes gene_type:complete